MAEVFNACEGVWWLLLAGYVGWRWRQAAAGPRRLSQITAVLLALFSVSDFIEVRTGAWWRPWPLLVLKALCVCGLVVCGGLALRLRKPPAERSLNPDDTI